MIIKYASFRVIPQNLKIKKMSVPRKLVGSTITQQSAYIITISFHFLNIHLILYHSSLDKVVINFVTC